MADYFVGDIQGCFNGLTKLLERVDFNPAIDTLWLTGDLVARGPESLQTIEYLYRHQDSVRTVLGNHDLHFLAVANGIKPDNPQDRLASLLESPRLRIYLDWLRHQPLLRALPDNSGYLSHAGLSPHWDADTAIEWAEYLAQELSAANYKNFLPRMYGNKPDLWSNSLSDQDKLKYSVSAFTRMRFCDTKGQLDFKQKVAPNALGDELQGQLLPWFAYQGDRFEQCKWVFGHWASLMGHTNRETLFALDTGYVWGNQMTLLHWQTQEKIQVSAKCL